MPQVTLRVRGGGELYLAFRKIGQVIPAEAKKHLRTVMKGAYERTRHDPGPVPTYQRRGHNDYVNQMKLKDISELQMELQWSAVEAERGNREFGNYMGGDRQGQIGNGGQAWMHKNRWALGYKEVERAAFELVTLINKDLDEAVGM